MDPAEWYQKFMADSDDEEPILFKDEGFKRSSDPDDRQAQSKKNVLPQVADIDSKTIPGFSGQSVKPAVDSKSSAKLAQD